MAEWFHPLRGGLAATVPKRKVGAMTASLNANGKDE
jgi:hypothetical protein